ncbi:putative nucleic acid-binding Zn ribbon protein [Streptomyces sp. 3330]|uniref:NADase-type glycan-binding domain-containing protein n=1 Tax=Streptomyces sp. 3330 TaxID=2817755 RepID=UPI002866E085|nr:zinc ribbon domain-containing protein [Streptomyces sp. 3330]MDR6979786.1 putative nucleic acid-binding Zn ribbon protein [Streptomyces sp. 3330]
MTTLNCAECGTRAEPGQSFCDACGAVLSWTDRPSARTGAGTGSGSGSAPGSGSGSGSGSVPGPDAGSATGDGAGAGSAHGSASGTGAAHGAATASAHGAGTGTGSGSGSAYGSGSGAASGPGTVTGADSGAVSGGSGAGYRSAEGTREPSGAAAPQAGAVSRTAPAPAAPAPAPAPAAPPAAAPAPSAGSGTAVANASAPPAPHAAPHATPEPTGQAPTQAPTQAATPAAADDDYDPDDEDTTETPLPVIPPEDGAAAPSGTAPAPAHAQPDATAPTAPVPAAAPAPALGDTMAARARSLLVPVADAEPRPAAPPSVAPVLPGRPVADRPQVRAPGPVQGEQYGVACPWCATPNNPDRHFCVRCAMPMTLEDRSSTRLPWWRRLFNRNGATPWAGDRPRLRRTFDRVLSWVVAAVVLTLLIIAGVNTPAAIQATRDHFAKRAPVAPDSFAASRSYPGHKPELAFDKINNSWWGPGVSQSGEGEWIEARFDEPTRLLDLIITSGTSVRPDQLSKSALPHRIKATITLKDGKTTTREIVLDQSSGGQRRAFRVGDVTKVRFTIESSYMASASKQVSIAEIEFFGRSSANST